MIGNRLAFKLTDQPFIQQWLDDLDIINSKEMTENLRNEIAVAIMKRQLSDFIPIQENVRNWNIMCHHIDQYLLDHPREKFDEELAMDIATQKLICILKLRKQNEKNQETINQEKATQGSQQFQSTNEIIKQNDQQLLPPELDQQVSQGQLKGDDIKPSFDLVSDVLSHQCVIEEIQLSGMMIQSKKRGKIKNKKIRKLNVNQKSPQLLSNNSNHQEQLKNCTTSLTETKIQFQLKNTKYSSHSKKRKKKINNDKQQHNNNKMDEKKSHDEKDSEIGGKKIRTKATETTSTKNSTGNPAPTTMFSGGSIVPPSSHSPPKEMSNPELETEARLDEDPQQCSIVPDQIREFKKLINISKVNELLNETLWYADPEDLIGEYTDFIVTGPLRFEAIAMQRFAQDGTIFNHNSKYILRIVTHINDLRKRIDQVDSWTGQELKLWFGADAGKLLLKFAKAYLRKDAYWEKSDEFMIAEQEFTLEKDDSEEDLHHSTIDEWQKCEAFLSYMTTETVEQKVDTLPSLPITFNTINMLPILLLIQQFNKNSKWTVNDEAPKITISLQSKMSFEQAIYFWAHPYPFYFLALLLMLKDFELQTLSSLAKNEQIRHILDSSIDAGTQENALILKLIIQPHSGLMLPNMKGKPAKQLWNSIIPRSASTIEALLNLPFPDNQKKVTAGYWVLQKNPKTEEWLKVLLIELKTISNWAQAELLANSGLLSKMLSVSFINHPLHIVSFNRELTFEVLRSDDKRLDKGPRETVNKEMGLLIATHSEQQYLKDQLLQQGMEQVFKVISTRKDKTQLDDLEKEACQTLVQSLDDLYLLLSSFCSTHLLPIVIQQKLYLDEISNLISRTVADIPKEMIISYTLNSLLLSEANMWLRYLGKPSSGLEIDLDQSQTSTAILLNQLNFQIFQTSFPTKESVPYTTNQDDPLYQFGEVFRNVSQAAVQLTVMIDQILFISVKAAELIYATSNMELLHESKERINKDFNQYISRIDTQVEVIKKHTIQRQRLHNLMNQNFQGLVADFMGVIRKKYESIKTQALLNQVAILRINASMKNTTAGKIDKIERIQYFKRKGKYELQIRQTELLIVTDTIKKNFLAMTQLIGLDETMKLKGRNQLPEGINQTIRQLITKKEKTEKITTKAIDGKKLKGANTITISEMEIEEK